MCVQRDPHPRPSAGLNLYCTKILVRISSQKWSEGHHIRVFGLGTLEPPKLILLPCGAMRYAED